LAWHEVSKTADVPEGEALQVRVGNQPIAIYRINGQFYATQDICTHAHAHLTDGYVEGDCVECPLHAGIFHIPTGKPVGGPVQIPLKVYPVKVEGDTVLIET
jgi:nitrite reductase/ring-hydroxylating ferredoxin subunit